MIIALAGKSGVHLVPFETAVKPELGFVSFQIPDAAFGATKELGWSSPCSQGARNDPLVCIGCAMSATLGA